MARPMPCLYGRRGAKCRVFLDSISVLVPPAIAAILQSPQTAQGFLDPERRAIMGYPEGEAISARYQAPIVVTGFELLDILEGR